MTAPRLRFTRSCRAAGVSTIAILGLGVAAPSASASCLGDVTGNHIVNVNDLLAVIDTWGPCGGCASDMVPAGGNAMVDVNDLLAVLNNWGDCACTPLTNCVPVTSLWCEDWELGNYIRWTGGYNAPTSCEQNGFATDKFVTPVKSHRSAVVCTSGDSHRGYGGLRFQGDTMLPSFTIPSTGGINAPNGVVVTFWSWLDVPYTFSPTRWLSLLTVTHDCSNNWSQVVTLNLDDSTMRIKPVHVSSVSYVTGAPSMPLQQWVRTTAYINYNAGSIHVWQNGQKVCSATFSRPVTTMCQWHFGLYASGNNDDILLYEENISIVKLTQPLTNFTVEPWFNAVSPCASLP